MPRVGMINTSPGSDWLLRVSLGLEPGWSLINKFGRNPAVPTGGGDIWDGGGLYTGQPTGAAEALSLTSTSVEDAVGQTGLYRVIVFGLDSEGVEQQETVVLTGTTPAVTSLTYRRVNRIAGITGGTLVGALTCRHVTTTANIFSVVPAGSSQTQVACYTVPTNCTALLLGGGVASLVGGGGNSSREATVALRARVPNETAPWPNANSPWRRLFTTGCTPQAPVALTFPGGAPFPGGTDLKASVISASATMDMSAYFTILLRRGALSA